MEFGDPDEFKHFLKNRTCECTGYQQHICATVSTKVLEYLNDGMKLTSELFNLYVNYLFGNIDGQRSNSYTGRHCISESIYHVEVFVKVLQYLAFPENCIDFINDITHIVYILDILHRYTQYISDKWLIVSLEKHNSKVLGYLITKDLCTELYTTKLLNYTLTHDMLDCATKLIERGISSDTVTLEASLLYKQTNIAKLLLSKSIQITDKVLELACRYQSEEIMTLCLNSKIIPNQKCFNALLEGYNSSHSFTCKNANRYYTDHGCGGLGNYFMVMVDRHKTIKILIELLFAYGYVLTYDDMINATKEKICIYDIDRFGIKLDDKYLEVCAEVGYYPYKTTEITPSVKYLELECDKPHNTALIKKLFNDNPELKPSQQALMNACKYTNNITTINLLVSKGAVMDFDCVQTHVDRNCNKGIKRMISMLRDNYVKKEVPIVEITVTEPEKTEEVVVVKPKKKIGKKIIVKKAKK